MRQALVAALIALAAFAVNAYAQQMPVTVIGAVTAGHCASFNSTNVIKDAGAACGGSGGTSVTTTPFLTSNPFLNINPFTQVISTGGVVSIGFLNVTSGAVWAGPIPPAVTTGPTFRFINQLDLPPIDLKITTAAGGVFNILGPISGGTGLSNPPAHGLLQTTNANLPWGLVPASLAGNIIIDQGVSSDWATKALSGDCTLAATGAITCTKSSGVAFGTFAFQNFATPPAIGGGTPNTGAFTTLDATTLQINAKTMTFPVIADTICGETLGCTWAGPNQFRRIRVATLVITSNATAGVPYNVNVGADYFICLFKTTGSASVVNLPSSPQVGDVYVIKDCKGDDATNAITVNSAAGTNTDNIEGAAAPFTMNASTATFRDLHAFTWSGNTSMGWILN